jgi:magnesium-transporting ATPase (P-type)
VSFHFSKIEYNKYLITQAKYNVNIASGTNTNNLPKLQEVENPSNTDGNKILKIIMLFIAIIVVAIPEGLLLTVTLSLAFAITKMQADNNLVRFMTSCETMGYANN